MKTERERDHVIIIAIVMNLQDGYVPDDALVYIIESLFSLSL